VKNDRAQPTKRATRRIGAALVSIALAGAAGFACTALAGFEDEYELFPPDAATSGTGGAAEHSASSTGTGGAASTGGAGSGSGGGACDHPVCKGGGPLVSSCDPCATTVCNGDPFCCTDNWDGTCVSEAIMKCGTTCCGDGLCIGGNTCAACPQDCGDCGCAHSVCEEGEALSKTGCHALCPEEVCATTPSCCGGYGWEKPCIDKAAMLCGKNPDPCVEQVCKSDPSCCTIGWTAACVQAAKTKCAAACSCAHPICAMGAALAVTCDPCVATLCKVDGVCCAMTWDQYCIDEVATICGIDCT